ncbi:hypothetical protein [Allokutzneria oryzae]|uniref:hypothetical protein n=1 Tax=Allokutzneria oryzae TaxID=1378989 RepID=UPI00406BC475
MSSNTALPRTPLLSRLRAAWFSNVRADVLSGLVVGLYASFTIAFSGGRPGMISAATGAMALVTVPLVRDHGAEYLFAATVLTAKFAGRGVDAEIVGLNAHSEQLHTRLSGTVTATH